ncbi:MAG: DUF805 domain-containing protein [Bacteroidetes bacterium]|nr:DUF805 domain-containing protein [Bacteroidota bacterium]
MKYYLHVLKNYANFKGRARRKEYWMFVLFNILILIVLTLIEGGPAEPGEIKPLSSIYQLAVILPSLAVAVRRMHDVGKSGWFILIPIYNFILAVTAGQSGANEYGPDPKNPEYEVNDHLVN